MKKFYKMFENNVLNVFSSARTFLIPLFLFGTFLFSGCKKSDNGDTNNPPVVTVKDQDGNVYHTVKIGTQTWMVENLKTTKYRNGDLIPNITADNQWIATTSGAYCMYENSSDYGAIYGKLYNWAAVIDSRGICPVGWHVPTETDWGTLSNFLNPNGEGNEGGKMKETGLAHWHSPNTGASNSSGFTALPGGYRSWNWGNFDGMTTYCYLGTSSLYQGHLNIHVIECNSVKLELIEVGKTAGVSIRCIKD